MVERYKINSFARGFAAERFTVAAMRDKAYIINITLLTGRLPRKPSDFYVSPMLPWQRYT